MKKMRIKKSSYENKIKTVESAKKIWKHIFTKKVVPMLSRIVNQWDQSSKAPKFGKNDNFGQKLQFWCKIIILVKNQTLIRNHNFGQKS